MNKTWIAVLVGALMISVAGLSYHHISASSENAQLTSSDIKAMVEEKYPGQITELELERKNGQLVYEVELEGPDGEYELKIDAQSGKIVKLEQKHMSTNEATGHHETANEHVTNTQTSRNDGEENNQLKEGGGSRISVDEAKKIALREVSGTVEDIELENDDGLLVYEVEIKTKNGEAEVEVDAITGQIIMIAWDD